MQAPFSFAQDEKPFIGYLFLRVAETHQIPISLSDLSTVAEQLTVACQRRWCGSLAVQEAAMLCRKQLRHILLIALSGLFLGACVPYSDGDSYYRSDVYTSPAPYYSDGGYYTAPRRYYSPPARYYQPSPRYYYQPRVYQPAPRYYDYRGNQNRGWDRHDRGGWDGRRDGWDGRSRGNWSNDSWGHSGRDHRGGRGDHDDRDGRGHRR